MMRALDHLEEWLVTFLMGAATVIIFIAVLHRYASGLAIPGVQDWLLGIDLGWAQELCIIMFVWMAKFGAAYGVRTGIHVGVDVLINRLQEGLTTPDLEWPTWLVYSAVPLGSYLMCFRFLQVCLSFVRSGALPHHDHGHVDGVEEEPLPAPGEEDKVFRLDDDLHAHHLADGKSQSAQDGERDRGAPK